MSSTDEACILEAQQEAHHVKGSNPHSSRAGSLLGESTTGVGQSLSGEQQEVWTVIEESWDAIVAKDLEWTNRWVHPNAVTWNDQNPMPRTRDAVREWDRYDFDGSTTLVSDFALAGIVVEGTTAVAHYYYSLGNVDPQGERETVHGRCTDILIAGDDRWQFIAWNCGDEAN